MPAFEWTIVDLDTGEVKGTNDFDKAKDFIDRDSYVVLHKSGFYHFGDHAKIEVEELDEPEMPDPIDSENPAGL